MDQENIIEAISITKLGNTNISLVSASMKTLRYSIPTIVSNLLLMVTDFTNIFLVSRLGHPDYIASFGLAQVCVNISCLCIVLGMTSASETLCSQAYGNKNLRLTGEIFNRGQMIMLVLGVIISGMMFGSNYLLQAVGMDKSLTDYASHYIRPYIFSAFIFGQFELTKRFLQAQQIYYPQMIISAIFAVLHPLWSILLMRFMEDKFAALAIARNFTNLLSYVALILYIIISKCCKDSWRWPNRSSFKEWKPFLKLGVYGIMFTCMEWWAFELVNVFAGYIGTLNLAANIICTYINTSYVMIPLGIGMAATSLVGNSIGELNSYNAKQYARAALLVDLIIVTAISIAVLIFSKFVSLFFTEDGNVATIFLQVLPLLMLEETTESIQSILGKVIVGMGKQDKIAKVGIIVYYLVVLPAAYLLAVKLHWGLFGIWSSISVGMIIISIWYAVIIFKTNWEDLIEETIGFLALMSAKIEDEDIDDISREFDTRALDLDK